MKLKYFMVICIFAGAFLLGVLSGLSTPFLVKEQKVIPVMKQNPGREASGGNLLTSSELLSVSPAGENKYGYFTIRLKFSVREYGQSVHGGDYFLYRLPAGYKCSSRFRNGVIRKGDTVIASFQRIKKEEREFIKIILADLTGMEAVGQKLSGALTLEITEDL